MSPSAVSRDSSPSKPSSWRRASSRSSSFSSDSRSTAMGSLPSVRNSQRAPRPPVLSAGRARPGPPGSTCPAAPAAGPAGCRWPDGSWRNGLAAQHDEFDAVAVGAQPALLGLVAGDLHGQGFRLPGGRRVAIQASAFQAMDQARLTLGKRARSRLTARPAWPAAARCRRACPRRRRGWAGPARCGVRRRPGRCARRPATGPAVDREDGAEQGQRGHQDRSQPAVAAEPMARAAAGGEHRQPCQQGAQTGEGDRHQHVEIAARK